MKKTICSILLTIFIVITLSSLVYSEDIIASLSTKDYHISEYVSETSSSYRIIIENDSWIESVIVYPDSKDVELLSNLVYGEGNGLSTYEKSLIVWCVLNRVDSNKFPDSIEEVVKQKSQFYGYRENNPITEENNLIVRDVLIRYYNNLEGRTLPSEYLFFHGDGKHNYYRKAYKDKTYFKFKSDNVYDTNTHTTE